jgi:hypothetical protein
VAQWNGVSWSPLGSGFGSYEVRSLARMPNGDIIAGGSMFHSLSRWNGVSWNPVPGLDSASSATPSTVFKVAVHPSGDLVATGLLFMNGVPTGVVRWNGVAMQSLNPPVADAQALIARANGDIWIRVGSASAPNVFRWDGTGWTWVSPGPVQVFAFAEDGSGRLLVGADPWSPIEGAVARFDGVNWQTLGEPTPPNVHAMVRMQNGDIVIGGSFASFRGVAANNLARWNGSVWSPLGLGVDGSVSALAAAPNGDLVVSGSFDNAGGAPANRVARWNGQSWSTLGGGLAIEAETLAAGANGEVLALGLSHDLHRFDGLAWSTLTVPLGPTSAVVSLPNGTFAIGGLFFYGSSGVAIVNGGTITPLPGGPAQVWHLLADSRGGLVASGTGTRRWDGTTWTALQTPYHTGLGELPNGELILSGPFLSLGGGAASSLYRMRNGAWESFGEVRTFTQPFEYTEVVIANGHGDLFVAGSVQSAGNVASLGLAQGRPTCPATASVFGAGCTGGAGPVTLVANNEPWVGTTFTATASGMTASSLSVQLLGSAAPALPLPGGAPGCSLFVAPILMDLLLPSAGIATSAWAVPALPSLAGLQVRLQVVGIELGAAGIVRLTSTNALELTIGML